MQVAKDTVVSMHYTLTDATGVEIESSRPGGQPIETLIGHGGIIPGLEKALIDHVAGDRVEVDVQPGEAYGERNEGQVQRVPKKYFRDAARLKPGMVTTLAMKEGGQHTVSVIKLGSSVVDIDLNHPLAGKTLHFDVEIVAVRAASFEEIEHKHVHGSGGVQH